MNVLLCRSHNLRSGKRKYRQPISAQDLVDNFMSSGIRRMRGLHNSLAMVSQTNWCSESTVPAWVAMRGREPIASGTEIEVLSASSHPPR